MTQTTHPSKNVVNDYFDRRTSSKEPPPTPEEIRRQLGWDLVPENKQPNKGKQ